MKEYMRSIGFDIVLETFPIGTEMNDPEEYTNIDIEFYRLRMVDPDLKVWHDIKIEPYTNIPINQGLSQLL